MDMQNMQPLTDFRPAGGNFESRNFDACWAISKVTGGSSVVPFYIRRAENFMRGHLQEQLCVEDIAVHAGVSARTLHAGFRTYRAVSVMIYLRNLRLDRVHEELGRSQISVTEAAIRCGFSHLGRFAQDYKRRFGLSPSVMQRRRAGISCAR